MCWEALQPVAMDRLVLGCMMHAGWPYLAEKLGDDSEGRFKWCFDLRQLDETPNQAKSGRPAANQSSPLLVSSRASSLNAASLGMLCIDRYRRCGLQSGPAIPAYVLLYSNLPSL